jgi:heptosyltransferase III
MPTINTEPSRSIVLRSGALGDSILTLPLIRQLSDLGPVTVLTRDAYFPILRGMLPSLDLRSIDSAMATTLFHSPDKSWQSVFDEASVYSFLNDQKGNLKKNLRHLGVKTYHQLPSRTKQTPHIVEQMFSLAGLALPTDFLETSPLAHLRIGIGTHFWIHPGSGSTSKNTPLEQLRQAYESNSCKIPIIASFGEADSDLLNDFKKTFANLDCTLIMPATIADLLAKLAEKAAIFLGNDSGPTHLSAALGIPTIVSYCSTDPVIWKPLGLDVKIERNIRDNPEERTGLGHSSPSI